MLNKNNQIFSSWGDIFVVPGVNPWENNTSNARTCSRQCQSVARRAKTGVF